MNQDLRDSAKSSLIRGEVLWSVEAWNKDRLLPTLSCWMEKRPDVLFNILVELGCYDRVIVEAFARYRLAWYKDAEGKKSVTMTDFPKLSSYYTNVPESLDQSWKDFGPLYEFGD